jgi:hypothetical protein
MDDSRWPREGLTAIAARIQPLCEEAIQDTGVDGAGVSLLAADGSPVPVLSSDDVAGLVEDLQFVLGEGPCFDATASLAPVLVSDLSAEARAARPRWPLFLNEAESSGVSAVFAFPLSLGAAAFGTVDFYRIAAGPLEERQFDRFVRTAGAISASLIADEPSAEYLAEPAPWVRMTVHQAAGMVMIQTGTTIEDALILLRATAYAEGRSVNDLAADVLDGQRRFEEA